MKKQTIALLFLIFTAAGLAAETGYNGIKWLTDTKKINLSFEKELPKTEEDMQGLVRMQERPILGTITQVFYLFYEGAFFGVSYCINSQETPRLLEKYNNLVFETSISNGTKEELREEISEITDENENMVISLGFFYLAAEFQGEGYKQDFEEGNGKIYIYDYNDDTRVYIFENSVEGITGVVYLPCEQDY